jgi:hypothetical protein
MLDLLFEPDDEDTIFIRKSMDFYRTTRLYNLKDRTLQGSDILHASAITHAHPGNFPKQGRSSGASN